MDMNIDLEVNEIGNDCIGIFRKLDLPKIKFISFFDNKITNPEIFEVITKFEILET